MTTAPTAAAPLSFAAAAGSATSDGPLKTVQIEGHVLLKILKHCAECAPSLVTGQLLGLDVGTTLEVTEAFPFPVRDGDMTPMGLGIDRVFDVFFLVCSPRCKPMLVSSFLLEDKTIVFRIAAR